MFSHLVLSNIVDPRFPCRGLHVIVVPLETPNYSSSRVDITRAVTLIGDILMVEDVSNDEEATSKVTIEDPIFLITIEDAIQSMGQSRSPPTNKGSTDKGDVFSVYHN